MRLISLLALLTLLMVNTGCSTFEEKELYGSWENEKLSFTFNEDKTMEMKMGARGLVKGSYSIFGNTLEIVNDKGKVEFSNLSVVKIENDSLYLNMMKTGSDNVEIFVRVN